MAFLRRLGRTWAYAVIYDMVHMPPRFLRECYYEWKYRGKKLK